MAIKPRLALTWCLALALCGCASTEDVIVLAQAPDIAPTGYAVHRVLQEGQPTKLEFSAKVQNINTNAGTRAATGPFKVRMQITVNPAPPPAYSGVTYSATGTTLLTNATSIASGQTETVSVITASNGVLYGDQSTYKVEIDLDPDAQLTTEAAKQNNSRTWDGVKGSDLPFGP